MLKRGCSFVLSLILLFSIFLFSFSISTAQETPEATTTQTITQTTSETSSTPEAGNEPDFLAEDEQEFKDAKIEESAGITPDSAFYGVDEFFDRFGDPIKVREEKIAEVQEMLRNNKIDAAREALSRYNKYAEDVAREVSPEEQEKARRSAVAIKRAITEVEGDIPEKDKSEFSDDVIKKEGKIASAAKVATQIKELCESLSELDPEQYGRVCRTDKNAPKWQKNLDKKLTDEQKKEAEEFFDIMSNCFSNPKNCECGKIKIPSFSALCNIKAPLAAKCEEGDIEACKEMDTGEDPKDLLPPHLQDVFEKIEGRYNDAHDDRTFERYMPLECQEAGAKTPKDCRRVMFEANAPEECVEAGLTGAPGDERKCEEIMFKANAPEECVEANARSPKECGKIMFKANAPEECISAGLTGESRGDEKKCREIMENLGQEREKGQKEAFGQSGRQCMQISDPTEKLKCFENSFSEQQGHPQGAEGSERKEGRQGRGFPSECQEAGALTREGCKEVMSKKYEERYRETKEGEKRCADECSAKGGAWDFSGGECKCHTEERDETRLYEHPYQQPYQGPEYRGAEGQQYPQPPQGSPYPQQYPQGEYPRPPEGQKYSQPPQEGQYPQPTTSGTSGSGTSGTSESSGTSQSTQTQYTSPPSSEPAPASSPPPLSPTPTGAATSGRVVGIDNSGAGTNFGFWDYWFK